MAYVRKAEPSDYDAIWTIWMQDHVIKWMSFPYETKEDFAVHYARLEKASDIYVVVNDEEKVVGVQRIKFGKDHDKHIAEYCSLGIHQDYQGRGYAHLFYEEFEKIVREAGVKRIQLTQSGGNHAAFHIADKKGFSEEAIFPDWLKRNDHDGDYYLIERYIYCFLDEELDQQSPSLKYQEKFPELLHKENESISYTRSGNQFVGYFEGKPLLTVNLEPDESVIQHIGFTSIELHTENDQREAAAVLGKIIQGILAEGRVKKIELFTPDQAVAELCQRTGFFVRGEKKASYFDQGEYKNELGLEYSFFNIADAKELIKAQISDEEKRNKIGKTLTKCLEIIDVLKDSKQCDSLGASYLENLIYQMVRDELGPNKVFSLAEKRWEPLLSHTPALLHIELKRLQNRLNHTSSFFAKNKEQDSLFKGPPPNNQSKLDY